MGKAQSALPLRGSVWRVYVDGVEVKANGDEHEAENEQAEGQGAVCPKVLFGLRQRAMRFSRATAVDH
jgi:hypothetical protein